MNFQSPTELRRKDALVTAAGVLTLLIGTASNNAMVMLVMSVAAIVFCLVLTRARYGGIRLVVLAVLVTIALSAGILLVAIPT